LKAFAARALYIQRALRGLQRAGEHAQRQARRRGAEFGALGIEAQSVRRERLGVAVGRQQHAALRIDDAVDEILGERVVHQPLSRGEVDPRRLAVGVVAQRGNHAVRIAAQLGIEQHVRSKIYGGLVQA
jgi:hypothetical protein